MKKYSIMFLLKVRPEGANSIKLRIIVDILGEMYRMAQIATQSQL